MLALLVLVILLGGALQRVTGMGFGLVAGPFIVLIIGPVEGVLVVNLAAALTGALILGRVVRFVDWRRLAWLVTTSVACTVPAALLLQNASSAVLEITVGSVVVVGMTVATLAGRLRRSGEHAVRPDARLPLVVTGVTSGFGSVAAGIGGPPLAVYSVLSGWDPRSFAATAQPYFALNALAALASKTLLAGAAFPALPLWQWGVVLAAILGGLVVGDVLAPRVSARSMRGALVVLSYAGGLATLGRGLAEVMS